jgi:hypothetical protein
MNLNNWEIVASFSCATKLSFRVAIRAYLVGLFGGRRLLAIEMPTNQYWLAASGRL